uniref:Secreted protein n=1 Tax=Anopheles merus TaxID=30066 RepID=A0A182UQ32_ANOME
MLLLMLLMLLMALVRVMVEQMCSTTATVHETIAVPHMMLRLTLIHHRAIELVRIFDLILRLVILQLDTLAAVLDVLDQRSKVLLSVLSRGWAESKPPIWSILPPVPPPRMLPASRPVPSRQPPSNPPSVGVVGAVVVTVLAAIVPLARDPIEPNVLTPPPPPTTLPKPPPPVQRGNSDSDEPLFDWADSRLEEVAKSSQIAESLAGGEEPVVPEPPLSVVSGESDR